MMLVTETDPGPSRNLRYMTAVELTVRYEGTGLVWRHGDREAHSFEECIALGWVVEESQ